MVKEEKRKPHSITSPAEIWERLLLIGRYHNEDASHTIDILVNEEFDRLDKKGKILWEWVQGLKKKQSE